MTHNIIDAVNTSLDPVTYTPDEETTVLLRAQAGDTAAAQQILRNYMGLIVNEITRLVRSASNFINDRDEARDEAFSDAVIVFYRVLAAYKPERGPFGGLFRTALRSDPTFTMVSNRSRAVTVPRTTQVRRAAIIRAAGGDVEAARELAPSHGMPVSTFDAITQMYQSGSGGVRIGDSSEPRTPAQVLPELRYTEPEYVRAEDLLDVKRALAILDPKERDIICGLYGLDGWPEHSQRELAAELRCSAQTVRRVRDHAMLKIQKHFEIEEPK